MEGQPPAYPPGYTPPVHPHYLTPPQPPGFDEAFGGVHPSPPTASNPTNVRFAPLSALPPERRLPPRRGGPETPGPAAQPTQIVPRELPGAAHANPSRQLTRMKQIGFNCPSCLAILIIKQPENYDGQAAPCPNCNVVILPPRIAPATPFSLLGAPPVQGFQPPVGLPPQPSQVPSHIPMGLPAPKKPGLPGARKLAQAALF